MLGQNVIKFILLVSSVHCTFLCYSLAHLYPVVLVPGDGGSQFEAKLNKSHHVHWYCQRHTDYWFALWLDIKELLFLDCLVDNLRLQYDKESRTTFNAQGVDIRQPGFGNTSTVEWLDSSHTFLEDTLSYFYFIVEYLHTNMGYVRNENIRGAPYDFRKAPNEMKYFVDNLIKLIEETFVRNNHTRVALLGHSMGNLYVLYALNQQPQAWKDKYIHVFISLSGPWGGTIKTLRLMASGDNLGQRYFVPPLQARPLQRSMTSTAWMMPYDTFWNADEILVYGPRFNYTVADYKRFFIDIDFADGYLMREDTEYLIKNLKPPGVTVHCLFGNNITTPAALRYTSQTDNWYDEQPVILPDDGDGTVNNRSLNGCLRWKGHQNYPVYVHVFGKEAEHLQILQNENVQKYIMNVLKS